MEHCSNLSHPAVPKNDLNTLWVKPFQGLGINIKTGPEAFQNIFSVHHSHPHLLDTSPQNITSSYDTKRCFRGPVLLQSHLMLILKVQYLNSPWPPPITIADGEGKSVGQTIPGRLFLPIGYTSWNWFFHLWYVPRVEISCNLYRPPLIPLQLPNLWMQLLPLLGLTRFWPTI